MRKHGISGLLAALLIVLAFSTAVHAAEAVTVKGEIIDTYCYSLMGAKGESHRQCALDCVKAGIPAGILEEGTGRFTCSSPTRTRRACRRRSLTRWAGRQPSPGRWSRWGEASS